MNRRYLSLLEVMVALAILAITATAVGWRTHAFFTKKKFQSSLEQLSSRMFTLHQMAVNMQADWRGVLKRHGNQWIFEASCIEQPSARAFPSISLSPFDLLIDGREEKVFTIEFFSSGEIRPKGHLVFRQDGHSKEWTLPDLFQKEQENPKRLGPIHPGEITAPFSP